MSERMTDRQIELARHALGLGNGRRQSYRNYFTAGVGHNDYEEWLEMSRIGAAIRRDGRRLIFGGDDLFHLTRAGAEQALRSGETLDPEHFPHVE